MSRRAPRRTGTPALDLLIEQILDASGATANRDQLFEILVTATRLAGADVDVPNTLFVDDITAVPVRYTIKGVPSGTAS